MIKQFILSAFIAIAITIACSSCTSDKIQVIHNDNVITNTVPLKSFNDESYIWEKWTVGTNSIDKIY